MPCAGDPHRSVEWFGGILILRQFSQEFAMRWQFCGIVALGILVGAVGAQDDAAKKDLDNLQGVWQLLSLEVEGDARSEDQVKKIMMTFKGNKASHPGTDGKIEEATFTL